MGKWSKPSVVPELLLFCDLCLKQCDRGLGLVDNTSETEK